MAINSAQAQCGINGSRVLSSGVDNVASPSLRQAVGDSRSYSASTTPSASALVCPKLTLTAGAYTIDLTALPDINGATTSLSGLKPRTLFFENLGAASLTVAKGASNGLALNGSWTWTLSPGARLCLDLGGVSTGSITAIGSGNKTIDVSGTGTDSFDFGIIAG